MNGTDPGFLRDSMLFRQQAFVAGRWSDADSGKLVKQQFERRVERSVTVRGAGGMEQRPTVTMSICLGDKVYEEWFTLRDRSKMIYPVLLGRRLLAELGPVDSSRTFTVQPACH